MAHASLLRLELRHHTTRLTLVPLSVGAASWLCAPRWSTATPALCRTAVGGDPPEGTTTGRSSSSSSSSPPPPPPPDADADASLRLVSSETTSPKTNSPPSNAPPRFTLIVTSASSQWRARSTSRSPGPYATVNARWWSRSAAPSEDDETAVFKDVFFPPPPPPPPYSSPYSAALRGATYSRTSGSTTPSHIPGISASSTPFSFIVFGRATGTPMAGSDASKCAISSRSASRKRAGNAGKEKTPAGRWRIVGPPPPSAPPIAAARSSSFSRAVAGSARTASRAILASAARRSSTSSRYASGRRRLYAAAIFRRRLADSAGSRRRRRSSAASSAWTTASVSGGREATSSGCDASNEEGVPG